MKCEVILLGATDACLNCGRLTKMYGDQRQHVRGRVAGVSPGRLIPASPSTSPQPSSFSAAPPTARTLAARTPRPRPARPVVPPPTPVVLPPPKSSYVGPTLTDADRAAWDDLVAAGKCECGGPIDHPI